MLVFQSIGTDGNGTARPQNADAMIRATYDAMDANGDGRVTPEEFKAFSMGFEYLAQVRGKLVPFNAAKATVFRRWDANKAGFLTYQEYRAGLLGDLTRSAGRTDTSDLKLSLDELQRADFIRELIEALR